MTQTGHSRKLKAAFRGFGEAGSAFAAGWQRDTLSLIAAFDEKIDMASQRDALVATCGRLDVLACPDPASALSDADLTISLVYADRAVDAAEDSAQYLPEGSFYIDGNSCSPQSKSRAYQALVTRGVHYIDMAIMAPVHPAKEKTPVLLSGPRAEDAAAILSRLGMRVRTVGNTIGQASAIKLTRSIMVKGLEALCAECFLAARLQGVEDEVIASLEASDTGFDWRHRRNYAMDRMTTHGRRRAAEMEEAANMVVELGINDDMARATAKWERLLGELPVQTDDVDTVLAALGKA